MAAAKLLTNMSSSMNSLKPWGWTNPIFSRDIHGFHVQIKRLPLFHLPSPMPSHTLAIPCHWPGKSWSKARLLSFLLSQHLGNLLWGWLLFPGWRSGHWARSHTAAEAHGKFLSPYALFCFVFPILSFLLFFRFLSWNSLRKKNPSLHHLHPCDCWSRGLAVDRGLAGNNKSTLLVTLTVAQVRLYWTYIPQFLFIITQKDNL